MNENNFLEIASDMEVRSVIHFLWFKKNTPIQIHCELKSVYGVNVILIQQFRKWCWLFDEGRNEVADFARSGRPSIVSDTFDELEFHFQQISRGTLHSVVYDHIWDFANCVLDGFPKC